VAAPTPVAGARLAFDRSLELRELRRAAEDFAARHGEPGSAAYRAAWLKFRQQIRSIEDLERLRAKIRRRNGVSQIAQARAAKAARQSDAVAGRLAS
jgi:hypothetical protein